MKKSVTLIHMSLTSAESYLGRHRRVIRVQIETPFMISVLMIVLPRYPFEMSAHVLFCRGYPEAPVVLTDHFALRRQY